MNKLVVINSKPRYTKIHIYIYILHNNTEQMVSITGLIHYWPHRNNFTKTKEKEIIKFKNQEVPRRD